MPPRTLRCAPAAGSVKKICLSEASEQSSASIPLSRRRGTEKLTGCTIERAYVDKGYRGHNASNPRRVFISGQKRGVFGAIKRELRRRSAIEPVIGHMKTDGHLGRCHLKGREGDAANVVLSAVGHNLRIVLDWLRMLLRLILIARLRLLAVQSAIKPAS